MHVLQCNGYYDSQVRLDETGKQSHVTKVQVSVHRHSWGQEESMGVFIEMTTSVVLLW